MNLNVLPGVVQSFQFVYQQGVLYRLKALGERHNMDITIEGFHSWMWRGLSFLLPFLYLGYIFQLYNAYTLYKLCYHPDATWQVSKYKKTKYDSTVLSLFWLSYIIIAFTVL